MAAAGWQFTADPFGSITSTNDISPEQIQPEQDAYKRCSQETKWGNLTGLTLAQRQQLYTQELAEHQCLVARGYPSADPPSEQAYLDTFMTTDGYAAISDVVSLGLSKGELLVIANLCPPPIWFLNLDGL